MRTPSWGYIKNEQSNKIRVYSERLYDSNNYRKISKLTCPSIARGVTDFGYLRGSLLPQNFVSFKNQRKSLKKVKIDRKYPKLISNKQRKSCFCRQKFIAAHIWWFRSVKLIEQKRLVDQDKWLISSRLPWRLLFSPPGWTVNINLVL